MPALSPQVTYLAAPDVSTRATAEAQHACQDSHVSSPESTPSSINTSTCCLVGVRTCHAAQDAGIRPGSPDELCSRQQRIHGSSSSLKISETLAVVLTRRTFQQLSPNPFMTLRLSEFPTCAVGRLPLSTEGLPKKSRVPLMYCPQAARKGRTSEDARLAPVTTRRTDRHRNMGMLSR